jgi:hypothetical protein
LPKGKASSRSSLVYVFAAFEQHKIEKGTGNRKRGQATFSKEKVACPPSAIFPFGNRKTIFSKGGDPAIKPGWKKRRKK